MSKLIDVVAGGHGAVTGRINWDNGARCRGLVAKDIRRALRVRIRRMGKMDILEQLEDLREELEERTKICAERWEQHKEDLAMMDDLNYNFWKYEDWIYEDNDDDEWRWK